jgi:hypothetical protein
MNLLQCLKFTQCLAPTPKDNGNFDGNGAVDTRGLKELAFLIETGDLAAAVGSTAEGSAVKIEECDTVGGDYTDVTGAALADAIAETEDNSLFYIVVDLKKSHKRFMRVNAPHAGDGSAVDSLLSVVAIGVPDKSPINAEEAGLAELILP